MAMVIGGKNGIYKDLKINFLSGIGDGAFYTLAMGMVPLATVLTYFISGFVEKKSVIGLLAFFSTLLSLTPQLFVAKKLEKVRRNKPFLIVSSIVQRIFWLLLGLDVILFSKSEPLLFVILFYILYAMIGLSTAFTGLSWVNMIAKIIPDEHRARFIGLRASISGLFESAGALLMGIILSRVEYPYNYGILFIAVFFVSMLSVVSLLFTREGDSEHKTGHKDGIGYLKRVNEVYKKDKNYMNYLLTTIIILVPGKIIFTFQVIYVDEKIGLSVTELAAATFIMLICQTAGYFFWGFAGNRIGLKMIALISTLVFYPSIILIFILKDVSMFYISIGFLSLAQSARNINENNLMINLCRNENDRPLYVGLRNTILGPILAFNPIIAGFLYDKTSFSVLFIMSLIGITAGFVIMAAKVRVYE